LLKRSLALLIVSLAAATALADSEARVATQISGDGSQGSVVGIDTGWRHGLRVGRRATVRCWDDAAGGTVPCAYLEVLRADWDSAEARIVWLEDGMEGVLHRLATFRPDFRGLPAPPGSHSAPDPGAEPPDPAHRPAVRPPERPARMAGGNPPSSATWDHDGEGSEQHRREILKRYPGGAPPRNLFFLDEVRISPVVVAGDPLDVDVLYSAASPGRRAALPASLVVDLRLPDRTLLRRVRHNFKIVAGGGTGTLHGDIYLPGDIAPGDYLVCAGLGDPGRKAFATLETPLKVVKAP